MKQTVKRWCSDFGYGWYGPGIYGTEKYDYKIHFEDGSIAMFRTAHGKSPKTIRVYNKQWEGIFNFPCIFTVCWTEGNDTIQICCGYKMDQRVPREEYH